MGGSTEEKAIYQAALGLAWLSEHGAHTVLTLLNKEGPEAVWAAAPRRLMEWGVAPQAAARFDQRRKTFVLSEAEAVLASRSVRFIPFGSHLYPTELGQLRLPPAGLFARGDEPSLESILEIPRMTIVGTRKATSYGLRTAEAFASAFAAEGVAVVSGMALGIDACAHEAALRAGGLTMAVLGCGVDVAYPRRHLSLYKRIEANGVIVSELPPGANPSQWTFPHRNRLLAALGDASLVVEASQASGALQTANRALELGRAVFSVPGPIWLESHEGCNLLLYDGAYPALEPSATVEDFLFITRIERGERRRRRRQEKGPALDRRVGVGDGRSAGLDGRKQRILDALGAGPRSVDDLVKCTGMPVRELTAALAELELLGRTARAGPGLHIRSP